MRRLLARAAFRCWPFPFGHVSLMRALDPPAPNEVVTRRLRGLPLQLRFQANTYIGRFLYYRGMYEEENIASLRGLLRPGMTFVDVGANIGLYTIVAAHLVGATGQVVAIEPHGPAARALAANLALNGLTNVRICSCAVGRENGSAVLYQLSRANPAMGTLRLAADEAMVASETVAVRRLDDILAELWIDDVAGLKLDVEGAELDVLAGAVELFRRAPPQFVLAECIEHHLQRFGATSRAVLAWLADRGYRIAALDRGRWRAVDPTAGVQADILAIRA